MYDVELVRLICLDINNAKDDPQKEQELISLLRAVSFPCGATKENRLR